MTTRATGTFEIDSWDEEPYDERDGTKPARVRVAKTFEGDVEGVSTTNLLLLLLAYGAEERSAARRGASCLTPAPKIYLACGVQTRT